METNNPFMWILGFVLIFWVIGGGNGIFGNNRTYGYEGVQAVNNTVGQRDLLDTMFAGFGGLKDQATSIATVTNANINGISKQIDDNRYQDLLLAYNERGQKLTSLETIDTMRTMLEPIVANQNALACEVSKLPRSMPLYAEAVTACGQRVPRFGDNCGCNNF